MTRRRHADGPRLLIRADASAEIGAGHVMRCLALAQAWQDRGGRPVLASAALGPALRDQVDREGLERREIRSTPGSDADRRELLVAAEDLEASWVVLDGYVFPASWHEPIRAAGRRLLVIDDDGHLDRYPADVVLNQNASAGAALYPAPAHGPCPELLLGPAWALLRREFRDDPPPRPIAPRAECLLVTLGGSDLHGITATVLGAIAPVAGAGTQVDLVIGAAVAADGPIRAAARRLACDLRIHTALRSMRPLMERADVAICGGGSTCLELARLGVPALAIVLAENQDAAARRLEDLGCARVAGRAGDGDLPARIARELAQLGRDPDRRERMARAGRNLVDGRGAERVAAHLEPGVTSPRRASGASRRP